MLSQTLEYLGCFSSSSLYAMGVLPSSSRVITSRVSSIVAGRALRG